MEQAAAIESYVHEELGVGLDNDSGWVSERGSADVGMPVMIFFPCCGQFQPVFFCLKKFRIDVHFLAITPKCLGENKYQV